MIIDSHIQEALARDVPIVALESNVISSGLPYPQNIEIGRIVEEAIREEGATPATIGLLKGEIKVGLSPEEIEYLGTAPDMHKISRRDLPLAVANGWSGGTTVAATMYLAHLAGIRVFATGGIGGVHRRQPFDVSADLPELAQTPVIVVCSGAKAILDLPLTLEWLETHGVPVLGYETAQFPAFYTRSSGLPVDCQVNSPHQVARIYQAQRALHMPQGLLVTVPVPAEAELPADVMEEAIRAALDGAAAQGVSGKALTPYLLSRVANITGDASLKANMALLENNARVAAHIARALQTEGNG